MIERTERSVKLGLDRNPETVVDDIERLTAEMHKEGWFFLRSYTDPDLREVLLFFEREINIS
ncbi:MAG: hypothetical protein JNL74_17315 [Fibrobacteres bacterium]|nr:hypothetical protein [Fibrobacterota bacterium]